MNVAPTRTPSSRRPNAATIASANHSLQICQHHCPIAEVAAQFPELCEAEHEVIAALLGQHVQPLASIANGNDGPARGHGLEDRDRQALGDRGQHEEIAGGETVRHVGPLAGEDDRLAHAQRGGLRLQWRQFAGCPPRSHAPG